MESAPESQRHAAERRPSTFQLFEYAVFTIVLVNFCFYVAEDFVAFLYLDESASPSDVLEAFAVTTD